MTKFPLPKNLRTTPPTSRHQIAIFDHDGTFQTGTINEHGELPGKPKLGGQYVGWLEISEALKVAAERRVAYEAARA